MRIAHLEIPLHSVRYFKRSVKILCFHVLLKLLFHCVLCCLVAVHRVLDVPLLLSIAWILGVRSLAPSDFRIVHQWSTFPCPAFSLLCETVFEAPVEPAIVLLSAVASAEVRVSTKRFELSG